MSPSKWPRSPSHGKCSKRFCGSSRNYGRSHHPRQHEAFDCHAFKSNRQEECVQMPVKIARSAPRPSFGLPELLAAIHTSRQSCCKAGKVRIFALVWESSGESRFTRKLWMHWMARIAYFHRSVAAQFAKARFNCPSCGSALSSVVDRKYLITQLRRCGNCQLMFRTPTDDPANNLLFYENEYTQGFTTDLPSDAALADMKQLNFAGTEKCYS